MTQAPVQPTQAPAQPVPLPVDPALAVLFAALPDDATRREALKLAAKKGAEYFDIQFKAGMEALGLTKARPSVRLAYYYRKAPMAWEEQRAKYPKSFLSQQEDFNRLREREARGDLVPEVH